MLEADVLGALSLSWGASMLCFLPLGYKGDIVEDCWLLGIVIIGVESSNAGPARENSLLADSGPREVVMDVAAGPTPGFCWWVLRSETRSSSFSCGCTYRNDRVRSQENRHGDEKECFFLFYF